MKIFFTVLGGLVVLASIAPLWRSPFWWIRGFDFPRLQIGVIGGIAFPGYALFATANVADISFLAALAASVGLQLKHILPFNPLIGKQVLDAPEAAPVDRVSILVANVLTTNRRCNDLIKQVNETNPDIVLTLETDHWWQQQLRPLEDRYPYRCQCPQDNLYGMHLYSKLELIEPELRFLVERDVPSISSLVRLRNGSKIRLYGLHPTPPSPTENTRSTERDGELMLVGKEASEYPVPIIVTGDLNDVAWSETTLLFRRVSGLLDPRVGRGMFNSFHAKYWFLRWPLDHLFHSNHFRLVKMHRLAYFGLDHFPIYIELAYAPAAAEAQQPDDANREDHRRANRKIDAALNNETK